VLAAAEGLRAKLPRTVALEDLISAGESGLVRAIDTCDATKITSFENHSYSIIRSCMLNSVLSVQGQLTSDQYDRSSPPRQLLNDVLTKGLTRAERLIMVLYYLEDMTMKEIGATLDLSEVRISRMLSSAVKRNKHLRPLYASDEPTQELILAVQTISKELVCRIKRHPREMYKLYPRQFEELIAEILANFGWEVRLTPSTRDGGYDIYAITRESMANVQISWIIECKKYAPERKVGIDIVRKLHSVKTSKNVGCMMLATTSHFTRGVQEFKASRYDLQLKDYDGIVEWIDKYQPNPGGQLYIPGTKLIIP